ncbi:MAG: hypothetical protein IGR92_05005 [Leptolyngbyaceae cyanobacterium T60_A2020_046]|nr:hypothetical protein [Leptolyngbyaceae cyanobacterium T60_A2020_046]
MTATAAWKWATRSRRWLGLIGASTLAIGGLGAEQAAAAPSQATARSILARLVELPSRYEVGLDYRNDIDPTLPVIQEDNISETGLTPPSLWWNRDQLPTSWGQWRLIRNWAAFRSDSTGHAIVDLRIDSQYWDRLTAFEKYAFLNQIGTTAQSYGYQARIYRSLDLIGVYACDFSGHPELLTHPGTEVPLDQLSGVYCAAALGPFVTFDRDLLNEDGLFVPP